MLRRLSRQGVSRDVAPTGALDSARGRVLELRLCIVPERGCLVRSLEGWRSWEKRRLTDALPASPRQLPGSQTFSDAALLMLEGCRW